MSWTVKHGGAIYRASKVTAQVVDGTPELTIEDAVVEIVDLPDNAATIIAAEVTIFDASECDVIWGDDHGVR